MHDSPDKAPDQEKNKPNSATRKSDEQFDLKAAYEALVEGYIRTQTEDRTSDKSQK